MSAAKIAARLRVSVIPALHAPGRSLAQVRPGTPSSRRDPTGAIANHLRRSSPLGHKPAVGNVAYLRAEATSRIDVKHPLRIVALDASIGRKLRMQASPRQGPESAGKPSFHCERERRVGMTQEFVRLLNAQPGRADE